MQPQLKIEVSRRTELLPTDAAGAFLGLDNDTMIARAESQYRWVWNVSASVRPQTPDARPRTRIRELRFLAREIIAPDSVGTLAFPEVLSLILGDRQNFHPGDVGLLLRITRPTRLELGKTGDLVRVAGSHFYTRSSLENFLSNRLLNQSAKS
jgi:hypothetical protein